MQKSQGAIARYRESKTIARVSDLGLRYPSSRTRYTITLFHSSISKTAKILKKFFGQGNCFARFVFSNGDLEYFILASGSSFGCCVITGGGLDRKSLQTLQAEVKKCQVVGEVDRDILKRKYGIALADLIREPEVPEKLELPEPAERELIPSDLLVVSEVLSEINPYLYQFRLLIHGEAEVIQQEVDSVLADIRKNVMPCDQYSDDDERADDHQLDRSVIDSLESGGILNVTGDAIVCTKCDRTFSDVNDALQHMMSHYFDVC